MGTRPGEGDVPKTGPACFLDSPESEPIFCDNFDERASTATSITAVAIFCFVSVGIAPASFWAAAKPALTVAGLMIGMTTLA